MGGRIQTRAQKEEHTALTSDTKDYRKDKQSQARLTLSPIPLFPIRAWGLSGPRNQAWPPKQGRHSPLPSPHQSKEGKSAEHCLLLGPRLGHGKMSSWGWAGKGGHFSDKNKGCNGHKGITYFSGAIPHKGDSNKIGKLKSFVPNTMAATARAASRTKVTAGHGSGKTGRREAGLSS